MNFDSNVFAFNPLSNDPNLRDNAPMVIQMEKIDPAAMVTGAITVDVKSPFGLGKGEVYGIQLLNTLATTNETIGASVALHSSTAGYLTITINSDNATSTTNISALYCLIYGRILPNDPA